MGRSRPAGADNGDCIRHCHDHLFRNNPARPLQGHTPAEGFQGYTMMLQNGGVATATAAEGLIKETTTQAFVKVCSRSPSASRCWSISGRRGADPASS